ncbi:ribosomal protein S8 [Stachybotrys elegans]|uniref:Ribosomal protein S8 n=1 Tax=Stachybotrys elegans TaxID=80388 RepID=A0A8K0SYE5_9HYPO|nr:ribosomal protein S8 [Stachybotrys elegans]
MPSILNIANMCSHLQNASRGRLGITSIPNTKYNLKLALALHRSGLISNIYRGGLTAPTAEEMLTQTPEVVTHANVATRRLWISLRHWDGKPVLSKLNVISKPSRLVNAELPALARLSKGLSAKVDGGVLQGLNLGECLFVSTPRGVLEVREALAKRTGGLVLCRAS